MACFEVLPRTVQLDLLDDVQVPDHLMLLIGRPDHPQVLVRGVVLKEAQVRESVGVYNRHRAVVVVQDERHLITNATRPIIYQRNAPEMDSTSFGVGGRLTRRAPWAGGLLISDRAKTDS